MTPRIERRWIGIIALICAIAVVVLYLGHFYQPEPFSERYETSESYDAAPLEWNLTLVGNGYERILTLEDIRKMPFIEGLGGFFTTVGVVNGPYRCKGVLVEDLCEHVNGLDKSGTLQVVAPDGYMMVFSHDQVLGNFHTYDPETFREVPHEDLNMILMYEIDGNPLSDHDGKPFRIAIVSSEGRYLTEGHNWVKWVNKMVIRNANVLG